MPHQTRTDGTLTISTSALGQSILAFLASGAVVAAGVVAVPAAVGAMTPDTTATAPKVTAASASDTREPALDTGDTLDVEGVLQVVADESGSGGHIVSVLTDTGAAIEVTGPAVEDAQTGATFEGSIVIDGDVAEAVEDAATEEAAASAVAETQEAPVEIAEADITPPVAASVAAKPHYVDVLYAAPSGHWTPSVSDVDSMVSRLGDFWSTQSAGQVSSITRVSEVKYAAISSSSQLCTAQTMWNYAAGPNGFNRPGTNPQTYYYGGTTQTHLLVIVPGDICPNGSGLGTVSSVHAGGVTWSSVPNDQTQWDQVIFHEVGHNLGLGHSNLTQCTLPKVEGTGCTQKEYYDFYDVMGGGFIAGSVNNFHDLAALNVSQKVNLSALEEGVGIKTVTKDDGEEQEFTIQANGTDAGLRGLAVVNPKTGERTFVEYRYATGRDANAFYKNYSSPTYGNGVRFHRLSCATEACAGATSTLLRSTTGNLFHTTGESYVAPYTKGNPPVKVEVLSTSGSTATVKVSFDIPEPLTVGDPTITGTAAVGQKLTAKPGTWTAKTKFKYQWLADGEPIAKATAATYTLKAAELGKAISVKVTGTLDAQTDTKTSDETDPVDIGQLKHGLPTISGTPKVGKVLTAGTGKWLSKSEFTYQWMIDGVEVAGATDKKFTLRVEDLGKTATVRVTGTQPGYTTETDTSLPSKVIGLGVLTGTTPTITGTAMVGSELTANPNAAKWSAGTTFTYQWAVGKVDIAGATAATYTPGADLAGKTVTVKVTGTLTGYAPLTKSRASAKIKAAADATAPQPTITGNAQAGATLTAVPGDWPTGTTLTYQWAVDGEDVPGASAQTFKLTDAHIGKAVTVSVTGTLGGVATTSQASTATAAVAPAPLATGVPYLAGTATTGNKLIAYSGKWAFGTSFTYQWLADGVALPGETGVTLALTVEHVGKTITAEVTGTLAGHSPATVVTPEGLLVEAPLLKVSAPKITGTVQVGKTLTADPVTKTDGITHIYQWAADGVAIPGASERTYTLTAAEVGKKITVTVDYSKPGYLSTSKTSSATAAVR